MEMERRLREGKDTGTWTGLAGFEKHTRVGNYECLHSWLAELAAAILNPIINGNRIFFLQT